MMQRQGVIAGLGALALAGSCQAQDEARVLREELMPIAFLAGSCWTGVFQGSETFDVHCYEPVYDGQYLRDVHAVLDGPTHTRILIGAHLPGPRASIAGPPAADGSETSRSTAQKARAASDGSWSLGVRSTADMEAAGTSGTLQRSVKMPPGSARPSTMAIPIV